MAEASGACVVVGCKDRPKNPKHALCRRHWGMDQEDKLAWDGTARAVERRGTDGVSRIDDDHNDEPAAGEMLSSTKLGKMFELPPTRVNLVFQELGWIEKHVKGWKPTDRGLKLGAEVRESKQRGVPYVLWPAAIAKNAVLLGSVDESLGNPARSATTQAVEQSENGPASAPGDDDFRQRFRAEFRSQDGHMVRSRAEMLIDNWLYMQGIVHAVERKLPIEENAYCDFYIPKSKVYVEYWGLEHEPRYAARMEKKKAIYSHYAFNLVELGDDDIKNLDDVLPRRLIKYGIDCS